MLQCWIDKPYIRTHTVKYFIPKKISDILLQMSSIYLPVIWTLRIIFTKPHESEGDSRQCMLVSQKEAQVLCYIKIKSNYICNIWMMKASNFFFRPMFLCPFIIMLTYHSYHCMDMILHKCLNNLVKLQWVYVNERQNYL